MKGRVAEITGLLVLVAAARALGSDPSVGTVEPAELTAKRALIGREVVVDDRLRYFQVHGRKYDEFFLKRTPVPFVLPASLQLDQVPRAAGIRVRGTLRQQGDRLFCDVSSYEVLPADLVRLKEGVDALAPHDSAERYAWARWAERRAKAFDDRELLAAARAVEAAAIRIESKRPSSDPAGRWLELARKARRDRIAEPEPSAFAHRGLRARLKSARTSDELRTLLTEVESFFPGASKSVKASPELEKWKGSYEGQPYETYMKAPPAIRTALDHGLWSDCVRLRIEKRAEEVPEEFVAAADEASTQLPDEPEVARQILERGAEREAARVRVLRFSAVDALAKLYRDRLGQPEKAKQLYRAWLDDQRTRRLSPTDADGRLLLAAQYETLLGEQGREEAIGLLRQAAEIEPGSKDVSEAFLKRGFRRQNGQWVEGSETAASVAVREPNPAAPASEGSLLGQTPEQVQERLGGKPNRVAYSASQGQIIEQWIYWGPRANQYVNFLHRPGEFHPRAVAYYSLPRTSFDSAPSP